MKYRGRRRKLVFWFLEKAFDMVPSKLVRQVLKENLNSCHVDVRPDFNLPLAISRIRRKH